MQAGIKTTWREGSKAAAGGFLNGRRYALASTVRHGVFSRDLAAASNCYGVSEKYTIPKAECGDAIADVMHSIFSIVLGQVRSDSYRRRQYATQVL